MTGHMQTGVFVSDYPLDENEGAHGDVVLALQPTPLITNARLRSRAYGSAGHLLAGIRLRYS